MEKTLHNELMDSHLKFKSKFEYSTRKKNKKTQNNKDQCLKDQQNRSPTTISKRCNSKPDNHPKSRFKVKQKRNSKKWVQLQTINQFPNSFVWIIPEEQTNSPDRTVQQYP